MTVALAVAVAVVLAVLIVAEMAILGGPRSRARGAASSDRAAPGCARDGRDAAPGTPGRTKATP
jgi:hypothetical protein